MGYRCAVPVCRNHNPRTRTTEKSVKYYQFPRTPEIRAKWVSACRREDAFSADTSYICSEHFTPTDFHRDLKAELMNLPPKRNLKPDVIPTLNLIPGTKINEELSSFVRKRKSSETLSINKENKENLGKSDANGVNNGFIISYLGVPRLLIKNSDDSKISTGEGSQSRIISVDSEYASDIRSTFGSQEQGFSQMEHLSESLPNKNIFQLDELCRLCGSYSNRMKPIFEQNQYNYHEIISNHFPDIKIQKDDILPLNICSRCETNLVTWYQFFKTCNAVNKRFQSIVKKLTEVPPVAIAKEIEEKNQPVSIDADIEAMEVPYYEHSDDDNFDCEDDSVGEIEIVEITEEPDEAETGDIFSEEKSDESAPDVMPEEIEIEEKVEPLDLEQCETKAHNTDDDYEENELKPVKKEEVECMQIKEEIMEKSDIESIQRSPELSSMKNRELKATYHRRRRRIPTLNLRRMCHICGKIFKYPESLRRHLKTVHSDERPFKCHQCSSSFNRNHNLTIHIKVVHQRQRVYVKKHVPRLCDYCGKVLLSARSLEEHISSMHTKKALYECDKCHSTFYRKLMFDKHRVSGECDSSNPKKCNAPKPEESFYKYCEYCGLEFKKEHFYKKHKLKHMNNFSCSMCELNFEEGSSLKEHIESEHPEMKPFECAVCAKKFKNKALLNCHLVIHSGEKRYQCPHCSLKFLKKKYLSTHILVHTGERPYVCSICNKGFKQSGDMRKHKATHIRKQI